MQSASKHVHSPKRRKGVEHAQRQAADQVAVQVEGPGDETRGSQRSLFSRTCSRRVHQHAHAHAHERVWVCMYARACVESTSLNTYPHAHTSTRAHTHTHAHVRTRARRPYQYMHTCISYQSCACMHHNDLYFMHVNMHVHTSLCVYMIHIYIYLSAHICVYIFIHTLHAWMYMWVYKSIQIIYIMYRYTCHGCKCMMRRMCMLTCMHAQVYHVHQTTIGFARVCARAHVSAHACIRREGAGNRGQLQRSYVHTRAQTCTCIVRTHSITQRLAHTHTQNTHAAHMYSSIHAGIT